MDESFGKAPPPVLADQMVGVASDDLHLPEEGVYEPQRIWERPAGHAVQGVDAFKVLCHVNSLNEPAVAVIGDSGAAPTLISHKFLQSLQASKPKPRTGSKLKLIQLTGSAGCSEYVKLDLYFRSQLGPICLKGVEAYVVKGMEANLLIGEDTQLAWQLHTIRPDGKRHWKVGDSPHCIPALHRVVEVLYHSCFLLDYCDIMTKTPAVTHIFYFCCTFRVSQ